MIEIFDSIKKYNYWNGNVVETGYERTSHINKIFQYVGNKLIKVLVGQRRVGKSYILRQLAAGLIQNGIPAENILYINKEYYELNAVQSADDLQALYLEYHKTLKPKGKVYLFIDEIQYINQWERFVNSHSQDFAQPCELFVSGSNANLLSTELATLLSGRYIEFKILPYSFSEYCGITGKNPDKEVYMSYLQSGALPELLNLQSVEMRRNYISAIKDTVMLRDIVKRYKVKDVKLLDDLFIYVVNNSGNIISIKNIINYFASGKRKTNYETISSYLGYLENSFLIHRAERYNIKGKETISGNCKFYINDLGFYNYLYGGFGYGIGYLLENAVYLDLVRAGYQVYVGTVKHKEVDFVALQGGKRIYFQVCYQLINKQTIEREYASLKNIDDNYPKYVVTMDDFRLSSNEGIEHMNPWQVKDYL